MTTAAPTRPLLRYHGGKWMLAPRIIAHFPKHRIYVEPFAGGASVLLRKPRAFGEVYNDKDGDVVNLFRVARDRGEDLRRVIELTPFSRVEFKLAFQPTEEPLERARRLLVRSWLAFSTISNNPSRTGFRASGWRTNASASGDWAKFPQIIPAVVNRLRGVVIENREASEIIAQQDKPEALFYVDPPYVHSTRTSVTEEKKFGYNHELSDQDHEDLARQLNSVCGMVILSGYDSELYRTLYPDWRRVELAALADGGRARTEVLWLNAAATNARAAGELPL